MDEGFERLKRVISEKIGFFPQRYKERPLKRRIAVRMRYNDISSYEDYANLLESDEREQQLLCKTLTINVSKFFRNYETFKKTEEMVFPLLLENNEKIKVWCAGCAAGEETYTMAMLLDRFITARDIAVPYTVIGTDIDEDSIENARVGCYSKETLDETPEVYIKRYFERDAKGEKYCIVDEIKRRTRFFRLDIEEEDPMLKSLDIILFRNVLIYMKREFQEKILLNIYERLKKGGFLILGKVEILVGEVKSMFTIVDSRERIYRKCLILKK